MISHPVAGLQPLQVWLHVRFLPGDDPHLFTTLCLVSPVAGIVIAIAITGGRPVSVATRRIGVVSSDPNPPALDPLMMAGYPNCAAIGRGPPVFHHNGRRRRADADAHRLSGGLIRTDED